MAIEQQLSRKTTGGASFGQDATDKISFYGATPIVKPTVIAAGTDLATTILEVASIRLQLQNLGLVV